MPATNYTVATAAQLTGFESSPPSNIDELDMGDVFATDESNNARNQLRQRTVRFSPSTKSVRSSADRFVKDTGRVRRDVSGEAFNMTPALLSSELFPEEEEEEFQRFAELNLLSSAAFKDDKTAAEYRKEYAGLNVDTSPQTLEFDGDSKPKAGNSQGTDIFFSPLDVGGRGSNIEFSSPLPTPTPPLTPTQESYDAEQAALNSKSPLIPTVAKGIEGREQIRHKLTLGSEQLDHLVKALARSPLIRNLVRKQWWDVKSDTELDEQTSLLSLDTALKSTELSDDEDVEADDLFGPDESTNGASIYSLPNEQFLSGERKQANPKALFSGQDSPKLPNHPNDPQAPQAKLGGIAIINSRIDGSPVSCLSKDYQTGPTAKQVGECTFLNIPYASSTDCHLRIERPATAAGNGLKPCSRIILQIINQVLERKTGEKYHLLVAEIDVTESFAKAALMELAVQGDVSLNDIEIVTLVDKARRESQEDVDWLELADELQALDGVNDIVDSVTECFRVLNANDCTMQTLTLISELNRLKAQYQDFMILQCHGEHGDGIPEEIEAPWISQHLDQFPNISSPETAAKVRQQIMIVVAQKGVYGDAFTAKVEFEGEVRRIHCVPLVGVTATRNVGWVCFLRDGFAI